MKVYSVSEKARFFYSERTGVFIYQPNSKNKTIVHLLNDVIMPSHNKNEGRKNRSLKNKNVLFVVCYKHLFDRVLDMSNEPMMFAL